MLTGGAGFLGSFVSEKLKVDFKRLKTGFVVVFYRPKWEQGEGLGEDGQNGKTKEKTKEIFADKILAAIKANPGIKTRELMDICGLSDSGIEWNLRKLKAVGRLRRIGPDKGGHWEVLPK